MASFNLHALPLLAGLSEEEVALFNHSFEVKEFQAGDILVRRGEHAQWLYFVLSGELTIKVLDPDETPSMVSVIGSGAMAGWSAMIPPYVSTAMVAVLTDARLVVLNGEKLCDICDTYPAIGLHVMRNVSGIISHRLDEARSRLALALERRV